MDKTEQFIKMSDCPEIQSYRKPKIEKMKDGRWHYEWELETGDYFATKDLYRKEERQIEIKGTTIYDPYFYDKKQNANIDISQVGFDEGGGYVTKRFIWLPRQDDIQRMMGQTQPGILAVEGIGLQLSIENNSWEKFWLAFYMHEKHSKIWSSKEEKWVKK